MMGRGRVGETLRRYDGEHRIARDARRAISRRSTPRRLRSTRGDGARIAGIESDARANSSRICASTRCGCSAPRARRRRRVRERIQLSARTTAMHQPRGGPAQPPDVRAHPAREPAPAADRGDEPAKRRAGRAGEPREVALPLDDEPRAPKPAQRRARAAGAARPGRARGAPAAAGRAGAGVRPIPDADAVGAARLRRNPGRALAAAERAVPRLASSRSSLPKALEAEGASQIDVRSGRARRSGSRATSTGCARSSCTSCSTSSRAASQDATSVAFSHDNAMLIGGIAFRPTTGIIDWKLDVLTGLSEIAPDQVTAEALRPLIARGLISATHGVLSLFEEPSGRPNHPGRRPGAGGRLRRRSGCTSRPSRRRSPRSTRRALRSERVAFVPAGHPRSGRRRARRQHQRGHGSAHLEAARSSFPAPSSSRSAPRRAPTASTMSLQRRTTCRACAAASWAGSPPEPRSAEGGGMPFANPRFHPVSYAEIGVANSTVGSWRAAARRSLCRKQA